jgi:hypothetical protein
MSLVLPVDATYEVVAVGFCMVFSAEFVGLSRGLSLEDWVVVRYDDEYSAVAHPVEGPIRQPERGGSEWEPIKFFFEESNSTMTQNHTQGFPHELAKVM